MRTVDWDRPWFAPWAPYGVPVASAWAQTPDDLPSALNGALGATPTQTFVAQHQLPSGVAYETYLFEHRQIPTRNNMHDFFNGLCWLRFPRTKAQLNRWQAQEIARHGVRAQRGRLRDALTVFDENAVLLWAPPTLWDALWQKNWQALFVTHRGLWSECKLQVFGHALLEKGLQPFKAMTAHVWRWPLPECQNDEALDALLSQQLTPALLSDKPFVPLPLSGVPGWWPENQAPDFYEDKKVFRD